MNYKFLVIIFTLIFTLTLSMNQWVIAEDHMQNRTISQQKAVNQSIFELTKKNGATEGKVYNFSQLFTSNSKEYLNIVRQELTTLGYQSESIEKNKKQNNYYIDAYKAMPYNPKVLEEHSLKMLALAQKYKVFYDGWGVELH